MKNEQSLDEIVKKVFPTQKGLNTVDTDRIMLRRNIWLKGAKYVEERMYSEDDMKKCWDACERFDRPISEGDAPNFNEFIEQFKKK